ncbi:MAG TPA: PQQ-binding-like beta-propeller repeat protein [Ktedonobacteraceae bacterium]|jgi:outer membrane protein assembly factor BamB|nr:PQQ-binding-like beta-propeller repeat protein [Ktedonobacteraceae bacterium]
MKQHSTTSNKPCPEWLEKLNAYHPDDLSPEEWAQLNKHLATCAQCRAAKAEYATINARILGLPRARPLPALPAQLQELMGTQTETAHSLSSKPLQDNASLRPAQTSTPTRSRPVQREDRRAISKLNRAAAILVIVVLLGSLLLLLNTYRSSLNTISSSNAAHLYVISRGPGEQSNMTLTELNPANAQVIWQQRLDNTLEGYGFSTQGNLYLQAQDGNIYAYRGSDGHALWHSDVSHNRAGSTNVSLLAYQNFVIAGITNTTDGSGDLYAFNAQTGAIAWHTALSCATAQNCAISGRLMLQANGIIYGLAEDGLFAWNAANGRFLWHNPGDQLNGYPQSMVVSNGKLYITNYSLKVDVLDAKSGRFLHSLALPEDNPGEVYDIATNKNIIYILADQTVSAYRASEDTLLWKEAFSYHSQGTIYAGNSGIYVNYYDITMGKAGTGGSDNYLYALDSGDGHILWQRQNLPYTGGLYPVEFNNIICIAGFHSVYGLSVSDGSQVWQFSPSGSVNDVFGG